MAQGGGGRKPNKVETVTLTLSTTPGVFGYLERLVGMELYGKTPPEVAERMLSERIRELQERGVFERRASRGRGRPR